MNRKTSLQTIVEFFKAKGKIMTQAEYAACTDAPISLNMVKRYWGSWNRVMAASARQIGEFKAPEIQKASTLEGTTVSISDAISKVTREE